MHESGVVDAGLQQDQLVATQVHTSHLQMGGDGDAGGDDGVPMSMDDPGAQSLMGGDVTPREVQFHPSLSMPLSLSPPTNKKKRFT